MIKFKRRWKKYKTGQTQTFNKALERRLVITGKAEYQNSKPILDTDVDQAEDLHKAGFKTVEKVLNSNLQTVKDIGKVTEKRIKDELLRS